MRRFINLIASFLVSCLAVSQTGRPSSGLAGRSMPIKGGDSRNAPCVGQPRSFKELAVSFRASKTPQASQTTGTWVEIGFVYLDIEPRHQMEHALLNCGGLKREGRFEFVLVADGYLLKQHGVGKPDSQTRMVPDHTGSVELEVDEGADEGPEKYRCRLTNRGTLLCLNPYSGLEFKKTVVERNQLY